MLKTIESRSIWVLFTWFWSIWCFGPLIGRPSAAAQFLLPEPFGTAQELGSHVDLDSFWSQIDLYGPGNVSLGCVYVGALFPAWRRFIIIGPAVRRLGPMKAAPLLVLLTSLSPSASSISPVSCG